ncbi:MAG: sugar phosphate nucleotidyltransferase [bacterium]|nr:sugar phosphate nucleotidyltransferase [bacterium]
MQAFILAAGKGTRLGKLTKKNPKSLIKVAGKPIIEYTLSSFPDKIKRIHIIIGHEGNKIKAHIGEKHGQIDINYIWQKRLRGTGAILKLIKPFVKDRVLILNGDDIYSKKELEKLIKHSYAIGLAKKIPEHGKYLSIKTDKNKNIKGAAYPSKQEMKRGAFLATGAYVLTPEIFKYQPVRLFNGEYGLPQTILKMAKKVKTKGIIMKKWIQINTPKDIKKAATLLSELRS